MTDKPADSTKRVLGIDFGTTRIGISLSDPLQIIASPFATYENTPGIFERIRDTATREDVGLIVVGMPLNLKGEKGKKALEVEEFMEELRAMVHLEIVHWDERFTTSIAQQTLLTMGTRREDRRTNKARVDAMAAAVMLQGYLDSHKRSLNC